MIVNVKISKKLKRYLQFFNLKTIFFAHSLINIIDSEKNIIKNDPIAITV